MKFIHSILCVLLVGLFASCDEPFSPRGHYEDAMVVYSVVATNSRTQFVRVYGTYDPPEFNPEGNRTDTQVTDAQVTMTVGSTVYAFRDTVLPRGDTSRYADSIHCFVTTNFQPSAGQKITLNVNSASRGNASAVATLPISGDAAAQSAFMNDPMAYPSKNLEVDVTLPNSTRGFVIRVVLEYFNTSTGTGFVEVPVRVDSSDSTPTPVYPTLNRGAVEGALASFKQKVEFPRDAYLYAVGIAEYGQPRNAVKFMKAHLILSSVEKNLYNGYNISNGFRDEFTVRTDQPDYSNISGGVGVFGGFTVDSTTVPLSQSWIDTGPPPAKFSRNAARVPSR